MNSAKRYKIADHCHLGEIDGYGYAFVPGGTGGVVLLDLNTKKLLEQLFEHGTDLNEARTEPLVRAGIIVPRGNQLIVPSLDHGRIKSISTWLHVSNACNLNCPYCYIANKSDRRHMPLSIVEAYLDKLEETTSKHGLRKVVIRLAGGEPTLGKKLVRYIAEETQARFAAKGLKVKLIMLTNGTLLDEDWLRLILKHEIGLSISLDGTKEWHDRLRFFKGGRGTFDRILHSIDLCKKFGIRPNILSTITEANIDNLQLFGRFLVDLNLSFRFGVYRDNTGGYSGYRSFNERLKLELGAFYEYYAEAVRNGRTSFMHQLSDLHFDKRPHLRSCNIGYSGVTVNHLGNVFLCQAGMDREPIGNLQDGRTFLEMAWSQRTLPELSDMNVLDYPDCRRCQWSQMCGGGCPLVNSSANGSATTSSPYCELFKAMIPKLIELKALDLIHKLEENTERK
jgi:uncharacterized protein